MGSNLATIIALRLRIPIISNYRFYCLSCSREICRESKLLVASIIEITLSCALSF